MFPLFWLRPLANLGSSLIKNLTGTDKHLCPVSQELERRIRLVHTRRDAGDVPEFGSEEKRAQGLGIRDALSLSPKAYVS